MTKKESQKTTQTAHKTEAPAVSRDELNSKARYDYGIMNAEDMSETQLKAEMKTVDDQLKAGQKEDAAREKANA